MLVRRESWYTRLQHRQQLESVPLPDRLVWSRLMAAHGASAPNRPAASVRGALLGLSLLFVLCTPIVMSSKKLELVKTKIKDEQKSFEVNRIKREETVEDTDHRTELKLSQKYSNCEGQTVFMNSKEDHGVVRSASYVDVLSKLEFAEAGAGTVQDSNVVFDALPKSFDTKAFDIVSENYDFIGSSGELNPNKDNRFASSKLKIATENSEIINQKKSYALYNESKLDSSDGGLGDKGVTGLDSGSGAPEGLANDDGKSAQASEDNTYRPATAVAAVCFLCFLMRLSRDGSWSDWVEEVRQAWHKTEQVLSAQSNVTTLAKQMIFLSACEKCLLPGAQLTSLYTLMFCSIVTYCVGYAHDLLTRQRWSLAVRVGGPTSSVRHLALSTTNIVLEWTKAVTFITTVVFLLLMLGLEKGLHDYSPSPPYIVIAALYWVSTEKVCRNALLIRMLDWRWRFCDSLEEIYVPLYLQYFQLLCLVAFTLPCLFMGHWRTAICGVVFVRMDYLRKEALSLKLEAAEAQLSHYRSASEEELLRNNDRCSICLCWMTSARVTPCQHFYHAECLLNILNSLLKCPMCQADLYSIPSAVSF